MKKIYLFATLLLSFSYFSCFGMLERVMRGSPSRQVVDALSNGTFKNLAPAIKTKMLLAAVEQIDSEQTTPYQGYIERLHSILKKTMDVDLGAPTTRSEVTKLTRLIFALEQCKTIYEQKLNALKKTTKPFSEKEFKESYKASLRALRHIIRSSHTKAEEKKAVIQELIEKEIRQASKVKSITEIAILLKMAEDQEVTLTPNIYILSQETRTLVEKDLAKQEEELTKQFEELKKHKASCTQVKETCNPDLLGKSLNLTYLQPEDEESD